MNASLEITFQTNLSQQSSVNKTWPLLCCCCFSMTSMHSDTDLLNLKESDWSDIFSLIYLPFLRKLVIRYCWITVISERCSIKIHIRNWSSEIDIEKIGHLLIYSIRILSLITQRYYFITSMKALIYWWRHINVRSQILVAMAEFLENVHVVQTYWTYRSDIKCEVAFFTKMRPLETCDGSKLEWSPLVFWVRAISLYILCSEL